MTIRSNPPGATVYVDQQQIGTTPVSHEFIYYGTRDIRLVADGYETLHILQPIKAPWYQWPGPLEFISENLVPWEVRDEQLFSYVMTAQQNPPREELLSRAEQTRQATLSRNVSPFPSPAGASLPGMAPPPVEYPSPYALPPPPNLRAPSGPAPPRAAPYGRRLWPTP